MFIRLVNSFALFRFVFMFVRLVNSGIYYCVF